MSEPRDPLIEAIHAAGEVPPPPARDAAFARAMRSVVMSPHRRLNRSVIALFAAALLAVPAAVFAERASQTPSASISPITFETPDPGSSIQREADDTTVNHEGGNDERAGSTTATEDRSGTSGSIETEHSGDGGTVSATDGHDGSGSGDGNTVISTPAPTPIPSATMDSSGSSDGPSPDGGSSGSLDGGTSGQH